MQTEKPAEWYLEGALGPSKSVVIPIESFPFIIGRHVDCHLSIASREVSREHAAITYLGDALMLADYGSTNHTFVNRQEIHQPTQIRNGDVLHFGSIEFRLKQDDCASEGDEFSENLDVTTMHRIPNPDQDLPQQFVKCEKEFQELIERQSVKTVVQPILTFADEKIVAYEILGRGNHPDLPEAPYPLFGVAEKLGQAERLSRIFRHIGVESALALKDDPMIFMNTHPDEMFKPELMTSLEELRRIAPNMRLVLEIHETAVTSPDKMQILVKQLAELNIKLSYDDFGAGQTRLNEIVDVPPDFLKFDISLIKNIHTSSHKKQDLVRTLVEMTRSFGIEALAEGVEKPEEAEMCKQMGFTHVQGFLYARPGAVESFS